MAWLQCFKYFAFIIIAACNYGIIFIAIADVKSCHSSQHWHRIEGELTLKLTWA